MMKRMFRVRWMPILLVLSALACYLPALSWGIPRANAPNRAHAWGVDDETPLGTLAQVHGIGHGPTPNRNLGYPLGHPLVLAAASGPYLAYLSLTHQLGPGSEDYPYGLKDPVRAVDTLGVIAHLVSTLFAIVVVLAARSVARDCWGDTEGRLAAVMTLTMFPMFYYARTGNVDMAQLAWMACAVAVFARILMRGLTRARGLWLGLFIGAAVGTKEPIAAAFVGIPLVLVAVRWQDRGTGQSFDRSWWLAVLLAAGGFILAFGLFSGLFLDSERYAAHLAFGRALVKNIGQGDIAFVRFFPWTVAGHAGLTRATVRLLVDTLTWPGLALGVAGTITAALRRSRSLWLIVPALTYLAVLFLTARVAQLRYMLPAAWTLAIFATYAVGAAWSARPRVVRWMAGAAAALMIGLGLGRGMDLTHAMLHDSRYAAEHWLASEARPGSVIAFFGSGQKLPYLAPDVRAEMVGEYRGAAATGAADDATAARIVERWRVHPPDFVIVMPDHSSRPGTPYPIDCPPSLLADLDAGRLGYQPAVVFETSSWMPWLRRPNLDHPAVDPPIRIYRRTTG